MLSEATQAAAPTTLTFVANVENQTESAVTYTREPWEVDQGGFLLGAHRGRRLFCQPAPGPGDFRLTATLSLATAARESLFVVAPNNELVLSAGGAPWRLKGRFFRSGEQPILIDAPSIIPDQVFNLELSRQGGRFTLSVDGKKIYEGPCSDEGMREVGFDPGQGTVKLYTLRGTGNFPATFLPRMSFDNPFGMQRRPRPATIAEVNAPAIIAEAPSNECSAVVRRDGSLEMYFITRPEGDSVSVIHSEDEGFTWSEPSVVFALPGQAYYAVQVLESADGALHAVYHIRGQGAGGSRGRLYEVYYTRRRLSDSDWSAPRRIVPGYIGAIRGFIQLNGDGRLLLTVARASSRNDVAPTSGPDYGKSESFVYWSDDQGDTWQVSPSRLRLVLRTENNTRYGAIEPVPLELKDGRLWLLVRDRQGRLQQSYSSDRGEHWSVLEPSTFISSDSPAELLRLRDGRILLLVNGSQFWANPRSYAMGGREVLQAALSADDGRTWSGFREVLQQTLVTAGGDRGTAYPSAVENADGKVLIVSGQGEGKRAIVMLDPDWLLETHVQDDLSSAPVDWTQYGDEGIKVEREDARPVLAIPVKSTLLCGGSWNFPMGDGGEIRLRLKVPATAHNVRFILNDHFTRIDDTKASDNAVFSLALPEGGSGIGWRDVRIHWSDASGRGEVGLDVDGVTITTQPSVRSAEWGVNYLRVEFRGSADKGALRLADVTAKVTP